MLLSLALVLAPLLQSVEWNEDDGWLRYKPGTWVTHKKTVVLPTIPNLTPNVRKRLLKEVKGDDFVLEESQEGSTRPPNLDKRARGLKTGEEKVTIGGEPYLCAITTLKTATPRGPLVTQFWIPAGSKIPVKISFEEPAQDGFLKAVAVDEKVEVLGKIRLCTRLEGRIKMGQAEGPFKLLLCDEIPGSQVRWEVSFKTSGGDTKFTYELQEFHEEK